MEVRLQRPGKNDRCLCRRRLSKAEKADAMKTVCAFLTQFASVISRIDEASRTGGTKERASAIGTWTWKFEIRDFALRDDSFTPAGGASVSRSSLQRF